jgi:hypothetical protein
MPMESCTATAFNQNRFFLQRASNLEVTAIKTSRPEHFQVAGRVDIGTFAPKPGFANLHRFSYPEC